ncbi:right-handed parallel beta-helix repeat-containing protein [Paracoccus sp. S-4012]|uniref:glycosyl hydrolase family 28-related protein n=1 Tax=Paracoccus sp. S-4012 TaxID=2665648 RepID=UPI0012AF87E4|nr:glycosyl hydrolase family 28-related protein [Paracoccus sp. S-4012]MRX51258.1 right-handed parallel beta-helix repeat-containing protein [Paracoccus sp. S-4012]
MNIAITEGLQLDPPGFAAGLSAWSRENGTPGSATWTGVANAAIVPADQDFGSCLEILKTQDLTRLRFMAETPVIPGIYLRISARLKAVAGNLPSVRIAGWAGNGARGNVGGVVQTGPARAFTAYGQVIEVSAIVGTGRRPGVHMAWGREAIYGHFGLDLFGANGGSVRIESIRIEDVTSVFLRTMMDWVDVRDYGAVGDGVADDRAAFAAADAAAAGREILVPGGVFRIGSDLTIEAPVRFQGTVTMPRAARLALVGSFNFPAYAEAFGDETEGFRRAVQALLGFTDHSTLDLCGRRVDLSEPLMLHEAVPGRPTFSNRRVIANGEIAVVPGPAWASASVTSQASYDIADPRTLKGVVNVAHVEVGARVTGPGVGREVYVRARNLGAGTLTLSQPLYGGSGTRMLTFTRDRYLFDMSGMEKVDRLNFTNINFICDGIASAIMLAPEGEMIHVRDCYVVRPKDRGITSIGRGCQDILVDRCQFLSNEMQAPAQTRTTIAINVNANDAKIRNNRFVRFGHFMVAAGSGHLIIGNHWFQGDDSNDGLRFAGLVIANLNVQVTVTANYIDNAGIEWTNEYEPRPAFTGAQLSFGGLVVTGNTFLASHTVAYFSWIVIKPYGAGHYVQGLTVTGNVFKDASFRMERVERVDTTFADLDYGYMRNIEFSGNTFNGISTFVANPLQLRHNQASAAAVWEVPTQGRLPLNGFTRNVDAVVPVSAITDGGNARVGELPWVRLRQGADQKSVQLNWTRPVKGEVSLRLRMDDPK